jgi:hypothetical protein
LDSGPCFAKDSTDFESKLDKHFFKFLYKQLKFENVDVASYEWKIQPNTLLELSLHAIFAPEIRHFAKSVCNYLAPETAYRTNNITMQNETYTRLQMTHQFRYDQSDVFLLPDNFEEVFQVSKKIQIRVHRWFFSYYLQIPSPVLLFEESDQISKI